MRDQLHKVLSGQSVLVHAGQSAFAHPPTPAGATFTTTFADDEINLTDHGMETGDGPFQFTTTDTLPAGFSLLTDYWAIRVDDDNLKAAASRADAIAGTAVAITDDGTGTHTLTLNTDVSHWNDANGSPGEAEGFITSDSDATLTNAKLFGLDTVGGTDVWHLVKTLDSSITLKSTKGYLFTFEHSPIFSQYGLEAGGITTENVSLRIRPRHRRE